MKVAAYVYVLLALAVGGCEPSHPHQNMALCDPEYLANMMRDEGADSLDVIAYQCVGRRALAAGASMPDNYSDAAREVVAGCMHEFRAANAETERLGIDVGHPEMGARSLEADIAAAEAHAMFVISRAHHCGGEPGPR